MKKKNLLRTLATIAIVILVSINIEAQVPQGINYQAVLRNPGTGNIMQNQPVNITFIIRQGFSTGTIVFQETHTDTTNTYGLVNLKIGNGTSTFGTFSSIQWGTNTYFLQVLADIGLGNVSLGTTQFISVPYAMVADTVLHGGGDNWGSQTAITNTTITGNGTSTNPLGIAQQGATNGQVLRYNGSQWSPATISGDNWGSQTAVTNTTLSGNGTTSTPLRISPGSSYQSLRTSNTGNVVWSDWGGYNANIISTFANAPTSWSIFDLNSAQFVDSCTSCTMFIRIYSPVSRTVYLRQPNNPNASEPVVDIAAGRSALISVWAINGQIEWYSNISGSITLTLTGIIK